LPKPFDFLPVSASFKTTIDMQHHFYLVSGQVDPNFDLCQTISIHEQVIIFLPFIP